MSKFDDNYDKIFGKDKPVQRGSFTQGPDGKLVPRGTAQTTVNAPALSIHKDFMSPIERVMITSPKQLAEHNKRHGVTNVADYGTDYIEKKAYQRVSDGEKYMKKSRREDINEAIARHS